MSSVPVASTSMKLGRGDAIPVNSLSIRREGQPREGFDLTRSSSFARRHPSKSRLLQNYSDWDDGDDDESGALWIRAVCSGEQY
jgi:hypothetical protein